MGYAFEGDKLWKKETNYKLDHLVEIFSCLLIYLHQNQQTKLRKLNHQSNAVLLCVFFYSSYALKPIHNTNNRMYFDFISWRFAILRTFFLRLHFRNVYKVP